MCCVLCMRRCGFSLCVCKAVYMRVFLGCACVWLQCLHIPNNALLSGKLDDKIMIINGISDARTELCPGETGDSMFAECCKFGWEGSAQCWAYHQ